MSGNIVHELNARGVQFHADDSYRAELKAAGANATVLDALGKARFVPGSLEAAQAANDLVKWLSNAGGLLRAGKFNAAGAELDEALASGYPGPETGFVMGAILVEKGEAAQAARIYTELLRKYPTFPELHTKLSFALYRLEDGEDSYKEAESALAVTPENAEALKNAGLALTVLEKYDAAIEEFRHALKLQSDYEAAWVDLGIAQSAKHDFPPAIESLKRAIGLDRSDFYAHYNLGVVYADSQQLQLAVQEYRLAVNIDPTAYNARHNLAGALMDLHDLPDAIAEFRQLEAKFPEGALCHVCLAKAMFETGDLDGAQAEYKMASSLVPQDPEPHLGLGDVLEQKKDFEEAMHEFKIALWLDSESALAHRAMARILLNAKRVKEALPHITAAVQLDPTDAYNHALYANILEADSQSAAAIREYKRSVTLDPSSTAVMIEYGSLLEKTGDWVDALEQFRRAAIQDQSNVDLQNRYSSEQKKFAAHLAELTASGKEAEADALKARMAATHESMNLSEQLNDAMERGAQAFAEQNMNDALFAYKQAVALAEKMQPHDPRLLMSLQRLGQIYGGMKDSPAAQATFEREIKVATELFGPDSMPQAEALGGLAWNALQNKDYDAATNYYARLAEITRKAYGEQSAQYAMSLAATSLVYIEQEQWEKSEQVLLRAERMIEANVSSLDDSSLGMVVSQLCQVYDGWGKPEQSLIWDQRLLAIEAKQLGENSPKLSDVLAKEEKALVALGRTKEAAEVDQRLKALQAGTGHPGSQH
ncbi:MAG TPA: tetratricopeptide repeat protein [Candidatus Acidoferrales bacterium]|nr:tetratricopeptide repeat protein [Candidatus Acidoferrales bacterium]